MLRIKEDLYVYSAAGVAETDVLLSSWGEKEGKRECCEWIGIRSDQKSGHVISLNLSPSTFETVEYGLAGSISSSFVDLNT